MTERRPAGDLVTSIVWYAHLHPWRTIEHCAVIILVLHISFNMSTARHHATAAAMCSADERPCCCPAHSEGPLSVFSSPLVTRGPLPSMSLAGVAPGQVVQHHDFRGDIYRMQLGANMSVNLMRTTAGTLRSGDLHNCTQYDVILNGTARLHTLDTETGTERSRLYGADELIVIPARVPHLFEFLEENYMLEWWTCEFAAWYYQPFRDKIEKSFAQQYTATVAAPPGT